MPEGHSKSLTKTVVGDDFHVGRAIKWAAPGNHLGTQNGCGTRIGNQTTEIGELGSLNEEQGSGERVHGAANGEHGKGLGQRQNGIGKATTAWHQ